MANETLYLSTDHNLEVKGLQKQDGTYLNSATVEATLKDLAGNEVSGVTWPLTLSYDSGSDGNYSVVIDDGVSITQGQTYLLEITATQGGTKGFWREYVDAKIRGFS